MSAATAEAADAAPPKAAGKKKLIIIILAAVLLLALGGGGATLFMMKKKAAAEAEAEAEDGEPPAVVETTPKDTKKSPPVFVPLEPFTVNLADREAERYAQVGVTLEIEDAKVGDELKLYMPAIRNNILMLLAHKTASELLTKDGKVKLAQEIRREAMLPLGYTLTVEEEDDEAGTDKKASKKKKKKKAPTAYPVKAVHFANIIIQ